MRIFRGLKGLGTIGSGRDYAELLARARRLREGDQVPSALQALREGLAESDGDAELQSDADFIECHLLLAECQVEQGLGRGDAVEVRNGLEALLGAETHFPHFFEQHHERWLRLLGTTEEFFRTALDSGWRPGMDKGGFRSLCSQLAQAWCTRGEFARGAQVCQRALEAFPRDPTLQFWLGRTAAAAGNWSRCVALTREALASGSIPTAPSDVIEVMDEAALSVDRAVHAEAEALKGEVLRRTGRWDEAYLALSRAEERAPGALPDIAVEGLLLATLRRRNYAEAERLGAIYGARGFGAQGMNSVATAVRMALDRSPERKHLWLFWSQLCLHLGRLGEALQGIARTLGLDSTLAEGVLAGCRSIDPAHGPTPAFRLGLSRVILTSGDVHHGLEALQWFDTSEAPASGIEAAAELCRETLTRDPLCLPARELLVRLLLRQNALSEALANGRLVLKQTGNAEAAATLTWRIGGAAQAIADPTVASDAREFEVEAWLEAGDAPTALEALFILCNHPATSHSILQRSLQRLAELPPNHQLSHQARLVGALIHRRLGDARAAAGGYLELLLAEPPPAASVLESASGGLAELLPHLPDRFAGIAALALSWLHLDRPKEARGPLVETLAARRPEAQRVLKALRARLAEHPDDPDWLHLHVVAELALGAAGDFASTLLTLDRLLVLQPEDPGPLAILARRIEERAPNEAFRRDAACFQTRVAILLRDDDNLLAITERLVAQRPAWCQDVAEILAAAPTDEIRALADDLRTTSLGESPYAVASTSDSPVDSPTDSLALSDAPCVPPRSEPDADDPLPPPPTPPAAEEPVVAPPVSVESVVDLSPPLSDEIPPVPESAVTPEAAIPSPEPLPVAEEAGPSPEPASEPEREPASELAFTSDAPAPSLPETPSAPSPEVEASSIASPPSESPRRASWRDRLASETVDLPSSSAAPVAGRHEASPGPDPTDPAPRRPLTRSLLRELLDAEVEVSAASPAAAPPPASASRRGVSKDALRELLGSEAPASPESPLPRTFDAPDASPKAPEVQRAPEGSRHAHLAALLRQEITADAATPRHDGPPASPEEPTTDAPPAPALAPTPALVPPEELAFRDLVSRGLDAAAEEDFVTAQRLFEEALELKPQNRLARYNLGIVRAKASRRERPQPMPPPNTEHVP